MNDEYKKWALVTGGAKRIGATIAETLHNKGFNVAIHYNSSSNAADQLCAQLNAKKQDSSIAIEADLTDQDSLESLIPSLLEKTKRLDVLINNASTFYPTPIEKIALEDWENLFGTNLKAPLFLSKYAAQHLKQTQGTIINIIDIHSKKPLKEHPIYGSAKSGLAMLTRSLASDLAPDVRVNGISPGLILWPDKNPSEQAKNNILQQIPLKKIGTSEDIANAVAFLIEDAPYITGEIIAIDGGRSIGW
ncbi:MAG: pteridine reductase [Gammaproteobacteria bacterium]|nr:pteridine reductase [Gammaproteobacteria bacterium]|tara:strand:- start:13546 stop:14289 length:744 start_codon:yes stop_codon:yes gene_type:complete